MQKCAQVRNALRDWRGKWKGRIREEGKTAGSLPTSNPCPKLEEQK